VDDSLLHEAVAGDAVVKAPPALAQKLAGDTDLLHEAVADDAVVTAPLLAKGATVIPAISGEEQKPPKQSDQQQQQQQQQQQPAAGGGTNAAEEATNVAEELMKLKQLLDAGIITKEIFDRGRKKALGKGHVSITV
jgi:hypothetical protein